MKNELTYPPLYKSTKTGAIQMYEVRVDEDVITVAQGQLNGKKQSYTTKCEPKNIGRSNETTSYVQAASESLSKWEKKLKSGYSISIEQPNEIQLPMKVKVYQDQLHNIPENVYSSPKLNGVNAEFRYENNQLVLLSRGGNEYPMIEHLHDPIITMLTNLKTTRVAGELYIHGEFLQDITAAVKKTNSMTPRLQFHIFDLPLLSDNYTTRETFISREINSNYADDKILAIPSKLINKSQIDDEHTFWTNLGYEGTVIYDPIALYEYNVQSSYIWKYKIPKDAEFKIVTHKRDKSGHPVFQCESNNEAKSLFWVKPKGTNEQRLAIQADSWHGMWMTIEFEMLSKDGKPQKPVGIGLRECDANGNPLE